MNNSVIAWPPRTIHGLPDFNNSQWKPKLLCGQCYIQKKRPPIYILAIQRYHQRAEEDWSRKERDWRKQARNATDFLRGCPHAHAYLIAFPWHNILVYVSVQYQSIVFDRYFHFLNFSEMAFMQDNIYVYTYHLALYHGSWKFDELMPTRLIIRICIRGCKSCPSCDWQAICAWSLLLNLLSWYAALQYMGL